MKRDEMPVGFAMALAMNPEAMQKFSALSKDEKQQVLSGANSVKSRDEMRRYVNTLVSNTPNDTHTTQG